jgi:1-aminocyclopropane-1-carboxylate synthase
VLTYGDGPTGSIALRSALQWSHVSVMNGVSSVIDALCFCIAEPGDGVLIARPLYVGFLGDFEDRAG